MTVNDSKLILLLTDTLSCQTAVFPHTPIIASTHILFPHLKVREQLKLTAVFHNTPHPSTLPPFGLADYQNQPINKLPHAARHALALANGLATDPDSLLLIGLGDGLSQSAQQQLGQYIHAAQQERPRLIFFVTRNLNAIHSLADEVWQIENEQVTQKWKTADFPAHLIPSVRYALTFSSRKTAVSFHEKITSAPHEFGLLDCTIASDNPCTRNLSVTDKRKIASLVQMAGHDLVTFRTMRQPLTVDSEELTSNDWQSTINKPSAKAAFAIAQSEWRRHFRSFWRGANVLLSNILVLGMALGTLQVFGQISTTSWLLMIGITLLMSAAMPIGWGIEAMYQWRKKWNGLSYVQLLPLAPITLWSGLIGGQVLILLTHMAVFLSIWIVAFADNAAFVGISILFWGLMAVNALTLIPLLACIPRTTNQAWAVGWGAFAAIIFSGAALNQIPATYWPLAWLWPFTADLIALAQAAAISPIHLRIPIALSLLTSVLWGWIGIRSFHQPVKTPQNHDNIH